MPQLSVCTRKWGLIRSISPCPRSPQPKCLDEIRPFSRYADSWFLLPPKGATVEGTDHLLWLTGHSPSSAQAIEVIGQQTLQDRLSLGSSYQLGSYTSLSRMTDPDCSCYSRGRCVSVSDGSFKDQYGTSAWAIEAESSVDRCTGKDIPSSVRKIGVRE
jgi:hypothetical protein